MEWFWQLVDRLQKGFASSALQSFSPSDWVILCVLFWGLLQGSRKGFSDSFGKLLGISLVSMLTLHFYSSGAERLCENIPVFSLKVAEPLIYFLLTIVLWLSVSWAINVFGKFFKVEAQGFLKTLGGAVFGVLRVALLLSFLAQFFLLLPIEPIQEIFKPGRTFTGHTIARLAPDLHQLIVSPFHKPALKVPGVSPQAGG
jgi:uncharacterized membrane protein required for colicin V production